MPTPITHLCFAFALLLLKYSLQIKSTTSQHIYTTFYVIEAENNCIISICVYFDRCSHVGLPILLSSIPRLNTQPSQPAFVKSKNLIIVLLCIRDHLPFVRYLNLFNCIELLTSYAVIVLMRVCSIYIKGYLLI